MSQYVFDLIQLEQQRQDASIELIASENFVSDDILKALGSCLTNKYTEGYPGNRYYGGCQYYDELEKYCQTMWRSVFKTDYHVNVQPHSGSQANFAAYSAFLKPGDTILTMSLSNGGHLTHGSSVNFSGKLYNVVEYGVDKDGFIDYSDFAYKLFTCKPDLVLAGASAYSRMIDFEAMYNLITKAREHDEGSPIFMVDMAHIAGLIATGQHPSPFGFADVITTTTHKTLRGPRGGLIFCKPEYAARINSAVFPGSQGGSLQNVIAAKAIAAEEALTNEYAVYIGKVVVNCKVMAQEFQALGFNVITGGTDNHLFMIDLSRTHPHVTGLMAQEELDKHGITLNKNMIPNDKRTPRNASGLRIGTAAMTTKGWKQTDFIKCARRIAEIVNKLELESQS